MDNKIQFIDQRFAHLRLLIPQCKAQSAAADKRLDDTIITLEIKRIEAINALEIKLASSELLSQYIKPDTLHMNMSLPIKLLILISILSQRKQNNFQHIHLHHIDSNHIHPNRSNKHRSQ